ncbi:MAG: DUF5671 domain-containing protein [Patescibacteria group bacterium]
MEESSSKGKGAFDAFLNLLSLITLGWMSISVGAVLFQIINKFFVPQMIEYGGSFSQGTLKFNIASAIIITPIFLAVANWLHKNYRTGGLNHQSGIHRWLTYLMLLASALTIIGRLVYQLFRFLDGDFALAVILRTVVILVIAGGIFGYYFYDLRRKDFSIRSKTSLSMFVVVVVVVLCSVIGSFFIISSPTESRALKFDEGRVNDLINLNYIINDYYQQNSKLPENFSLPQFASYKDPETGQSYEYKVVVSDKYEICAIFSLAAGTGPENGTFKPINDADIFSHGAGRQCFNRTVQTLNKNIPPLR